MTLQITKRNKSNRLRDTGTVKLLEAGVPVLPPLLIGKIGCPELAEPAYRHLGLYVFATNCKNIFENRPVGYY